MEETTDELLRLGKENRHLKKSIHPNPSTMSAMIRKRIIHGASSDKAICYSFISNGCTERRNKKAGTKTINGPVRDTVSPRGNDHSLRVATSRGSRKSDHTHFLSNPSKHNQV